MIYIIYFHVYSLFFLLAGAVKGAKELSSCSHQSEEIQISCCSRACFRYCSLLGFANNASNMGCHDDVKALSWFFCEGWALLQHRIGWDQHRVMWHLTSVLFQSPCCPSIIRKVSWKCCWWPRNQAYKYSSVAFLQFCKQGNVALMFFMMPGIDLFLGTVVKATDALKAWSV